MKPKAPFFWVLIGIQQFTIKLNHLMLLLAYYNKYIEGIKTSLKIKVNSIQLPELPQKSRQHEHKVLPANTQVVVAFLASHWTWGLYWSTEEQTSQHQSKQNYLDLPNERRGTKIYADTYNRLIFYIACTVCILQSVKGFLSINISRTYAGWNRNVILLKKIRRKSKHIFNKSLY